MLRRARFRAIRGGFRTEIFESFSRPQNLASEIVRDRTKIHAARRRAASSLWTSAGCGTAVRARSERISVRFRAISNAKFCGDRRENFSKISSRNPPRIARNLTRRSMPTLRTVFGDLCGSRRGCASSGSADFRAISHDFGREILRPRKILEIFGPKSAANRT